MSETSNKLMRVSPSANLEELMSQFEELKKQTARLAFEKSKSYSWGWLRPNTESNQKIRNRLWMWADNTWGLFILFVLSFIQTRGLVISLGGKATQSSSNISTASTIDMIIFGVMLLISLTVALLIIVIPLVTVYARWGEHWLNSQYSFKVRIKTTLMVSMITLLLIYYIQQYIYVDISVEIWIIFIIFSLFPFVSISSYVIAIVLINLSFIFKSIIKYHHPDQEIINQLVNEINLNIPSDDKNTTLGLIGVGNQTFKLFHSLVKHKLEHTERILIPSIIILAILGIFIDALSGTNVFKVFFKVPFLVLFLVI